jgi:hypothetical protein
VWYLGSKILVWPNSAVSRWFRGGFGRNRRGTAKIPVPGRFRFRAAPKIRTDGLN